MAKKKKEHPEERYNYEKLENIFQKISPKFEERSTLEKKIEVAGMIFAVYKVKDNEYLKLEITEDYVHAWRARDKVMMGSAFHYFRGKDEFDDEELYRMIIG